jgi:hypothetical protein
MSGFVILALTVSITLWVGDIIEEHEEKEQTKIEQQR